MLGVFGSADTMPPLLRPAIDGAGGTALSIGGGDPDGYAWRLGAQWANREAHAFHLDGSELSMKLGHGRAYVSDQRRHWGPSWVGSLVLDEGAPPVPALGWRKTDATPFGSPLLAWLGPWNLDVFVGTLTGHVQPEHPRLWGARLQVMPMQGLELGFSRVIEWGGSGRSESLGSLWKALIGHDNVEGDQYNPSNQLGGFDARYTLPLGRDRTVSVYGQAIGEDEAGGLPSMYLASYGFDASAGLPGGGSVRLFAERADTVAGGVSGHPRPGVAYRHSTYLQGYTQEGRPLGFPAGGDVTLTSVGLLLDAAPWSAMLMLHAGRAHELAQLDPLPGRLAGADAELALRLTPRERVGLTLTHWRDPQTSRNRAQFWWQHALR